MINIKSQWELDRPYNLLTWGHWFAFGNLILALSLSTFYIYANPLPNTFLGSLYLLTNWFGHFTFLALSGFILTVFPIITFFPYKRHIRGVAAVIATLLQMLLVLDVLAYLGLGYHLSASSLSQLKEVEDVYVALLGQGYWLLLLALLCFILAYQLLISNFTWKKLAVLQGVPFKNAVMTTLVSCFLFSHFLHLWSDATHNSDIAKQSNMFPASYPLTARDLLSKYELIDIKEHQLQQSRLTWIKSSQYILKPPVISQCDLTDKPSLDIQIFNLNQRPVVLAWLKKNNVSYQKSEQISLTRNLDILLFNLKTGLPGLYRPLAKHNQHDVNTLLGENKLSVNLNTGGFDLEQPVTDNQKQRAFIFYDPEQQDAFYRASVVLVGFEHLSAMPLMPQNLIASYINNTLSCPDIAANNLIDGHFAAIKSDTIFTNFADGQLNILYKDKSMTFNHGELLQNKTFSSNSRLKEPMDLYVIEQGIEQLTSKRLSVIK